MKKTAEQRALADLVSTLDKLEASREELKELRADKRAALKDADAVIESARAEARTATDHRAALRKLTEALDAREQVVMDFDSEIQGAKDRLQALEKEREQAVSKGRQLSLFDSAA